MPEGSLPGSEQAPGAIFRFVLNDEGFDVGFDAVGMDLCCFSIPLSTMPTKNLDDEETLSRLTGDVIHGVLLSLPESIIEMPDRLVYQLTDEVMAFNSHCGNGILHGWTTAPRVVAKRDPATHHYFDAADISHSLSSGALDEKRLYPS